jgi:general stress protein 26
MEDLTMVQVNSPSDLKYCVESAGREPFFFNKRTMSFFGDTMANYKVIPTEIDGVKVYELARRKPVNHGLDNSAYFDAIHFNRVFKEKD